MKTKKIIFFTTLVILASFTIGSTAQSIIMKAEQKNITNKPVESNFFDAEITFNIYEGEGCGCRPIADAYINATSSDGADYNITDENGTCILNMVINSEYRVTIEAQDYNTIKFDFNIIDDQTFRFHMGEKNGGSTQNIPQFNSPVIIQKIIQKLILREGINQVVS